MKIGSDYPKKIFHWRLIVLILIVILGLSILLATAIGPVQISPLTILTILINKLSLVSTPQDTNEIIIFQIRLPRIILSLLVGSALAVSGVVMQGIFKNPMADPYIIGISSGAAFGASSTMVLGIAIFGPYTVSFMAFLGAITTTFVVYNIARAGGKVPVETLLLSGIALASFLSALTGLITYISGEELHQIIFWLMGGLWNANWNKVMIAFPVISFGIVLVYLFARDLNVMLLGEEPAQHLGIETEFLKKIMLIIVSLITGVAVSVSGIIGFVGLIIPHIVRILVGPDHRILIPASALTGAVFLIWTDTLARTIITPTEIPVGIITALSGAPFFIYLLRRKKREMFG